MQNKLINFSEIINDDGENKDCRHKTNGNFFAIVNLT